MYSCEDRKFAVFTMTFRVLFVRCVVFLYGDSRAVVTLDLAMATRRLVGCLPTPHSNAVTARITSLP